MWTPARLPSSARAGRSSRPGCSTRWHRRDAMPATGCRSSFCTRWAKTVTMTLWWCVWLTSRASPPTDRRHHHDRKDHRHHDTTGRSTTRSRAAERQRDGAQAAGRGHLAATGGEGGVGTHLRRAGHHPIRLRAPGAEARRGAGRTLRGGQRMTPLQVIRQALQAGATLTMYRLPDGIYRVHVAALNDAGDIIMIELDESRLEQA